MGRRWVTVALGLVAGLLICASLPPWGWWPLAPAGIALWLRLLAEPGRRGRFLVSWAVGVAWFGPSTLWMWGLTQPGYVLGVLLAWGPMVGVVGALVPPDRRRLLLLPAAVIGFEWFHSHAPFGGVPLSMLAMTQARAPMLPIARLGGMLLLGAAVVALGIALYLAAVERRWREPVAILLLCAVVTGVGALPVMRPGSDGSGDTIRIAAVQGGGPQGTRFASGQAPQVFERHLALTREIEPPVDLVLWPENAINVSGDFAEHSWRDQLAAEAARLDAPILVGVVDDDPDDPDRFQNYVVVIEPDGSLGARYDKERRVPFGEYVPLRWLFEPIAGDTLPPRDQRPGEGIAAVTAEVCPTLDVGPCTAAVVISWEVFFSRRVREGVRAGGEVVLNPTNGSSYWLTQVQSQQLATSALRAVESGRWLVQVSPTGFSAVIDDTGRILERTGVSESRLLVADVPRISGWTPAQRLGDAPALVLAAALALLALRPGQRDRRAPADDPAEPLDHVP